MPKQQTDASQIKPDVLATVRLLSTKEGGRHTYAAHVLGCIFELDNDLYECRLYFESVGSIAPGGQAEVPIKFLSRDQIATKLKVGLKFNIREGWRLIGEGTIKEVFT
jgi:translation elongation factor EF-Tu-like GTPase